MKATNDCFPKRGVEERAWLWNRSPEDGSFACERRCAEVKYCKGRMDQSVGSSLFWWWPVVQTEVNLRLQVPMQNMWWVLLGSKYKSTKLQSTINERNRQCCKWSKRFLSFGRQLDSEWQYSQMPTKSPIHEDGGSQSKTTTQSGLVNACREQNESTTQTVCLRVFLAACIRDEFSCKQRVERSEKVLSSIDIEGGSWRWVLGEHWGETATGGDDFHGDMWCANKNNESAFVGLMGIAG